MDDKFKSDRILEAFSSMKTTDTISFYNEDKLKKLEKYYIDPFNYVKDIMQDEDNFITGRRGTGKSTLLYRAYVECMNSWSQESYKKRILPVFIDLSKCNSISIIYNDKIKFEENFTYELLRNFKKHMYLFWDKLIPCEVGNEESDKLDILDEFISELDKLIMKGSTVSIKETDIQETDLKESQKDTNTSITLDEIKLGFKKSDKKISESKRKIEETNNLTIGEFFDFLESIKDFADIESIYIFIDEYSELKMENQRILSEILKKFRGSRNNIFFKVSAITDNYDIGEIRLQRDFYEITLDLYKFVNKSKSIKDAFDRLEKYTVNIIQQRLNAYECNISIQELFMKHNKAIRLLTRASMGIPRTLGIILKSAWIQTDAKGKARISEKDLLFGINSAGDAYFAFFRGAIGLGIPKVFDDIFQAIIERARQEQRVNQNKGANMFLISSFRDSHFKYLTENYLLHLLKKGDETTVKGQVGFSVYMIDLSFINRYNLGFTLERDTYRQQRFVYDDVVKSFDTYFTSTRKAFICPKCNTEYTQEQLYLPQFKTYLSYCPKDNCKLEKIEGYDYNEQELSLNETERKIIGTIRNKTKHDALLAKEIADIVGCNKYKVATFASKIDYTNIIKKEKLDGESEPYRYYRGK